MFSRTGIRILISFLVFAGLWGIGFGATLQVFVRVVPNEAQVEIIQITLSDVRSGEPLQRSVMHEPGSVRFRVRSGTYLVRAESPGFQPGETEVALISFSRVDQALATVTLRRDPSPMDSLLGNVETTVSVDTLSIPSKAIDEMEKARKSRQDNDSEKAVEHLKKAIEIYPRFYQAYNNLAVEYTRLGRLNEAAQMLEKSIEIQPHDSTTHRNLGQLYMAFGRGKEALTLVQKSLELEPRSSKSLTLLGRLNIRLGNYETALKNFYQASGIDKTDHSHIGIGQCLTLLGRYPEALTEFKSFVTLFPDDPRASGVKTVIAQLEADLNEATR